MDNMKSNDDNLKKLNDANLDNVSGGTGTEIYQLTQALGIPFTDLKSVDLDQITSRLAQYGVSVDSLSDLSYSQNRYVDSETLDSISHSEVLRRIAEGK